MMKAEFINPFLASMTNVLSTMAQIESRPGKPSVKKSSTALGAVTGIIGMAGEQLKGSFAVSFSEPVIYAITKRMLGEEVATVNETVTDMVGELTNMATGGAKALLAEKGFDFDMAVPVMVSGKEHKIEHSSSGPTIILPFETDYGDFFIEISFINVN
ncbi:chemotaxis protein CheX [Pontibacterium granulatum]|uniref:chemotaxis protein CheX n=1 Tax=Pontibacterium granulatum TaxID=2036029 RepID=UPI00249B2C33|nr:chemotaxis protein CheX [Pontibacterium granulatum]MDI3323027.1 chemotaxis protein CheX [Pontibacterium granulatum]